MGLLLPKKKVSTYLFRFNNTLVAFSHFRCNVRFLNIVGPKYYKCYYLGVSGGGLEEIDLRQALQSIADFESLTNKHGPHKTQSRLKLLVSPSCRPPCGDDSWCFHYPIPTSIFEVIPENGHLGCGYIQRNFLIELLNKSVAAQNVFAIQVRFVGPATLGIGKGMVRTRVHTWFIRFV